MAEDKNKSAEKAEGSEEGKRSKKGILLGGGMVGLVAAAYIVSLVALPKHEAPLPFDGPFVTPLATEDIQVNLKGEQGRRYLVMLPNASYQGYDEAYVHARIADPVYITKQKHILISLARQKTMEDVADRPGQQMFCEEVREAIDPLLFPVHIGNEESHLHPDEDSGLAPGESIAESTMRGGFRAHWIHVNALKGELSLDDGPPTPFDGTETDLELVNENGLNVFVDTTSLSEDFIGDVNVGTFGRVREILVTNFLLQ